MSGLDQNYSTKCLRDRLGKVFKFDCMVELTGALICGVFELLAVLVLSSVWNSFTETFFMIAESMWLPCWSRTGVDNVSDTFSSSWNSESSISVNWFVFLTSSARFFRNLSKRSWLLCIKMLRSVGESLFVEKAEWFDL